MLDLTGVRIQTTGNGVLIRLEDLVKAGYEIYPERVAKNLEPIVRACLEREDYGHTQKRR